VGKGDHLVYVNRAWRGIRAKAAAESYAMFAAEKEANELTAIDESCEIERCLEATRVTRLKRLKCRLKGIWILRQGSGRLGNFLQFLEFVL
jgi:hypothetical protein